MCSLNGKKSARFEFHNDVAEDSSCVGCDLMALGSSTMFLQNSRHYLPSDAASLEWLMRNASITLKQNNKFVSLW
jgi:hypothetical protein